MAHARLHRLALLDRQLELPQPPPAALAQQVGERRFARPGSAAAPRWISFLARDRARTSCSRRASRRRNRRVSSSGAHTPSSSPAHNNRATVRASSRSVFAPACAIPVSPGLTTTTLATGGSRIATIAHAPPDTSNATRSIRTQAGRQHLQRLGRAVHPLRRAHLALLADRDLTEIAMHV